MIELPVLKCYHAALNVFAMIDQMASLTFIKEYVYSYHSSDDVYKNSLRLNSAPRHQQLFPLILISYLHMCKLYG